MPTRVLLEGPAIEPLLAQVREEYGANVKIISADKVRSGGIGGFFARQKYELSVEVPDDAPAAAEPTASSTRASSGRRPAEPHRPAAASLEELLAQVDLRERFTDGPPSATTPAPERTATAPDRSATAPDRSATAPDRSATAPDRSAAGLDRSAAGPAPDGGATEPAEPAGAGFTPAAGFATQAAAVTRNAGAAPSGPPALSANGAAFAEVMAGLGAAPATEEPGTAVRPFRPPTATGTPVNGARPTDATSPELVTLVKDDAEGAQRPVAVTRNRRNPYVEDALISELTSTAAALLNAAPAAPAVAQVLEPVRAWRTGPADLLIASLRDLGLPERFAERIEGADAYSGVLQALADLPVAPEPPDRPGDVLVVAGELAHAVPVARRIVGGLGLTEHHLLLAGGSAAGTGIHASRRIRTPEEAVRRARRMHGSDAPHVVVVDAALSGLDPAWFREIRDALRTTAVWAVVDATRKTGDTSRHLAALGEVEAIAVHAVAETGDPASVLGLELPITTLDGRPATRRAWAALLCERLTADLDDTAAPHRRRMRER